MRLIVDEEDVDSNSTSHPNRKIGEHVKGRFSKNRLLKVLDTMIAQDALEWLHRFGEETSASVPQIQAEKRGVFAVRIHAQRDRTLLLKHFIKTWSMQSSAFLQSENRKSDLTK
jgi:hypothetical protein